MYCVQVQRGLAGAVKQVQLLLVIIWVYDMYHAFSRPQVQQGLAGAVKRVQLLVVHLRQECVTVSAACARAGVSADNARRQLRVAFLVHQEACR